MRQRGLHRLAPIRGEDIVLPAEIKALLERNTVGFYRRAEALRQSGRAVRRVTSWSDWASHFAV